MSKRLRLWIELIVLRHVEGPLSFASARGLSRMLCNFRDKYVLAIDLFRVPFIDSSACVALEEVITALSAIGDKVIIFGRGLWYWPT